MDYKNLIISLLLLPAIAFGADEPSREFLDTLALAEQGDVDENLIQRIAELELRVLELEKSLLSSDSRELSVSDISSIRPGTYALETNEIDSISENQLGYVIYHVMTTVKSEETEYSIQFGAGRKGLLSWQFYIDYNNDGVVDMEMLEEFIDSLPFMGVLSRSIDADVSQDIYQLFTQNIELANHTSPDEIEDNAGTISRQIWGYVQTQSTAMADWIKQQYPESGD